MSSFLKNVLNGSETGRESCNTPYGLILARYAVHAAYLADASQVSPGRIVLYRKEFFGK